MRKAFAHKDKDHKDKRTAENFMSHRRIGKYFVIRSKLKSELVLEIQDGVDRPGIPIVTSEYDCACVDHQLWFWDTNTETIRSKHNSFCIDVKDNGLVSQPYQQGSTSQLWVVCEDRIQTSDDFEIVIGIEGNTPKIHANCTISNYRDEAGQHWTLEHSPAQYFYIRSMQDPKKVIDVKGDSTKPGTKVIIYTDKGDQADNQLWYEDEEAIIRSKLNGFVPDATGKEVILLPLDKNNVNQQWMISGCCLQSRSDPRRVLEMRAGGIFSDAQLVAAEAVPGQQTQNWMFDYVSDNSLTLNHLGNGKHYLIRSRASGLVLEVTGGSATARSPLVTAYRNASRNMSTQQLFYTDEVTGTIRTNLNNFCLDIVDKELVLNPYDPYSKTQQWRVTGQKIHVRQQHDQVWTLVSAGIEPGVKVTLARYEGSELQQWDVTHLPARCFYVVSHLNNKVLDIAGDDVKAGARVIMYDRKPAIAANQLWYEDERGIIRSKLNGFVLDATSDNITMNAFDPTNTRQYWVIVGDRLQNKYDNRLVLDIAGESKKNGARLCAYQFSGGDHQRWRFEYI